MEVVRPQALKYVFDTLRYPRNQGQGQDRDQGQGQGKNQPELPKTKLLKMEKTKNL